MNDRFLPPMGGQLPERFDPFPYEDQGYPTDEAKGGFDFRETLRILRRHVWLILAITAVVVGAVAVFVSRQEQSYRASALIRLSDTFGALSEDPSQANQAMSKDVNPMQTEIMMLLGRTVLGETVDRLGLRVLDASTRTPAPNLQEIEVSLPPRESRRVALVFGAQEVSVASGKDRVTAKYGSPVVMPGLRFTVPKRPAEVEATLMVVDRGKAMDYVKSSLEVEPRKGTNGIDVAVVADNRETALNVVNTIIRVYEDVQARLARQEATTRRKFFEDQLRKTDSLLTLAQSKLAAFRSRNQAYTSRDRFIMELQGLVSLEMRQQELEANRLIYASLLDDIRSNEGSNPSRILSLPGGIAQDPIISQLYGAWAQYRSARDSLTTGNWARAATHPNVQRLDTLIASTKQQLIEAAQAHVSSVESQVEALGRLSGRTAGQMSQLAGAEVEEVRLVRELEGFMNAADDLREDYQAARLEEVVAGKVEIIEPAERALPVPRNPILPLAVALFMGLVLGAGTAYAREKLDDSINRQEDVENVLMAPSLAVIPEMGARPVALLATGDGDSDGGVGLRDAGIEAYRSLRTNLTFSRSMPALKTLVVTSATPGEGKTVTAVNLAIVYAWQGLKVLLVDCDLRRPHLTRHFGINGNSRVDLPVVLKERVDPRSAILPSGIDGIDLLPVHAPSPNASELLGGPAMKKLLSDLSAQYDFIVLDSPPLLAASDGAVLGTMTDGVLLVVRAGYADRGAVQQAMRQLNHVGAHVVGAVLNDPESRVPRYEGRYAYDYSYADPGPVVR